MYNLSIYKPQTRKPRATRNQVASENPANYGMTDDQVIERALEIIRARMQTSGNALTSPDLVRTYLQLAIAGEEREMFGVVLLNNQHYVIDMVPLFFGTIDGASVYPREVAKLVLQRNATACIFVHNHPSGLSIPSEADKRITETLKRGLNLLDIRVLDHLIVSASETYSFAENGLI